MNTNEVTTIVTFSQNDLKDLQEAYMYLSELFIEKDLPCTHNARIATDLLLLVISDLVNTQAK